MNLVGMMLCHNEADRYLKEVIENSLKFCSKICILLERCTDDSKNVIRRLSRKHPNRIFYRKAIKTWEIEWELRDELLKFSLEQNPEYLIAIDADELYEDSMVNDMKLIEQHPEVTVVGFRFYDMWDSKEYYRFDRFYQCGIYHWERMFKVEHGVEYVWNKMNRHCGSIPANAVSGCKADCSTRVAHLGWMRLEDRIRKCKERREEDKGQFFSEELYDAILDKNPNLVKF